MDEKRSGSEPENEKKSKFRASAKGWLRDFGILLLGFAALTAWQERGLPGGEPAPAFALETLDGEMVELADLKGETVQLHFWATWCGVCKAEMGTLDALAKDLGEDERFYAVVNQSGSPEKVRAFLEKEGVDYPVLMGTREVASAYGVKAFPTNFYVSPDGIIESHDVGITSSWGMAWRRWRAGS